MSVLDFVVEARDGRARAGVVSVRGRSFETPAFMPVGTHGAVKTVSARDLVALGAQVILGNAYHLSVRPGAGRIRRLGGLHRFVGWEGVILTDSGGFQVMSLADLRRIDDEGVRFRSHLDGTPLFLSPEEALRIQRDLGSDIMMPLDECPALPAARDVVEGAVERTARWADRSIAARQEGDAALFGIIQGGTDGELRRRSAAQVTALPFDGFALGGLSVGEDRETTWRVAGESAPLLPASRPRYLMGLGRPEDLVEAVYRGLDMFDCVLPTRNARNGSLFVPEGALSIKRAEHAEDPRPLDEACPCETCRHHSRAYLRHLFLTGESLGRRLNTLHNLHVVLDLMRELRAAIREGRLADLRTAFWGRRGRQPPPD